MDGAILLKKVLIVDDSNLNIACARNALSAFYSITTATSGDEALIKLADDNLPDLILLDVEMPGLSGFQTIEVIKKTPRIRNIPVIFLTSLNYAESQHKGLSLGAVDYVLKPFTAPILQKRVELHLRLVDQANTLASINKQLLSAVDEKTQSLRDVQGTVLRFITDQLKKKGGLLGQNSNRISMYMESMLQELNNTGKANYSKLNLSALRLSAQLHGMDNNSISDSIMLKGSPITDAEFEILKSHTSDCANAISQYLMDDSVSEQHYENNPDYLLLIEMIRLASDNDFIAHAVEMIRHHHEKWDGTGYPDGMHGDNIPLLARILAVCEAYDELRSERSYKDSYSHSVSVDLITQASGTSFDPAVVDLFLTIDDLFNTIFIEHSFD